MELLAFGCAGFQQLPDRTVDVYGLGLNTFRLLSAPGRIEMGIVARLVHGAGDEGWWRVNVDLRSHDGKVIGATFRESLYVTGARHGAAWVPVGARYDVEAGAYAVAIYTQRLPVGSAVPSTPAPILDRHPDWK